MYLTLTLQFDNFFCQIRFQGADTTSPKENVFVKVNQIFRRSLILKLFYLRKPCDSLRSCADVYNLIILKREGALLKERVSC